MTGATRWHWIFLATAIVCEIIATSALKQAAGFTRPLPSLVVATMYAAAFYCLSRSLEGIPVGVAYAIWSGVGLPVVALIGFLVQRQRLDAPALAGIALIGAGVVVIGCFSRSGMR